MRIGLVVPGFSADESDWCIPALRNLVARLAREDDVRVLALRYPFRRASYEVLGAQVIALGGGASQGPGSAALWVRILSLLASEHRRQSFDLLHSFWAGETGMLTAIAGRLLGVPTVVSLAGGELVGLRDIGYGGQLASSERLKTHLALRLASRVTAGSQHLEALAARHLERAEERLRWAPLGVDTEAFQPLPEQVSVPPLAGQSPRERAGATRPYVADVRDFDHWEGGVDSPPRLVQAASLVPVKDQSTLIRACGVLRDMSMDFRLEIAGTGLLDEALRSLAAQLHLEGQVCLKGEVPHDHLPGFFRGAAAFVQSSLHEAQGMALLEAAACGVPAVGTRVGTLAELEPGAALGSRPAGHEELAAAVASLLRNPDRQTAMARRVRELVGTDYSLEKCVERFRSIYAQLT